jgi:IclR family KDG regulon transcriptional repressor
VSKRARDAAPDYTISAVARAAELLVVFERPPHSFRLSDLADRLGMTRNLTFRLLRTLEASGMIYRRDDYYLLGPRTSELGQLALKRFQPLVAACQPALEMLKADTGETVYLCAMEGQEAVCIAAVESDFFVRGVLEVGRRLPLHAGGGTKALLAWLPREVQDTVLETPGGLRVYTPQTPIDRAELRERLDIIRRDGYAVCLEEVVPGADAIGVPVCGPNGVVLAGLGLVGPADRVRPRLRHPLPTQLRAAAESMGQCLRATAAGTNLAG